MDVVQRKVNKYGRKIASLPHIAIVGRTLFTSSFFLSAWNDYIELSSNWEAADDYWRPRFGYSVDQVKHLVAVSIVVKILGGLTFVYGSYFGAILLLLYQSVAIPILHDFYNHRFQTEEFGLLYLKFKRVVNETVSYETAYNYYKSDFSDQELAKVGSKFRELVDHAVTSPALFGQNEFNSRFIRFLQGSAIVGALLFYVALKHKLDRVKTDAKVKTD
ncbi:PREDICTED: uncharacterized protein LOC104808614 [Tarenaya hassleriana]|uniref:uncharacterized protein LOC104808614 n=1 Tax=Tarenaya hassleriana TaxID=28532 RepID=UPI00053C1724|nr:PREDICTED: uncharacterized protein LOC104808614 [Tarenaya hassleriana]XP_010532629.1 PREDICTED: uncharacterized protein LOC104808614 [Tarenaya hassleriana]